MCAWAVTAEPDEFTEALEWFRSRVPHTYAELDALEDSARRRAFYLAGNLELEGVQTIFDELAHSIEKGTPFEEFQKRVEEKLGKLAPDGFHIETVYRNWVQTSYNTGRWYQLQDPELVLLRPYLMFDAVLDSRTTEVCELCNGIIKRHDDPFWLTHCPPLHHRCRSCLRSLRAKEAERRGITQGVPDGTDPQGDFGKAPPLRGDDDLLEPKQTRFDPEVWAEFKRRQGKMLEELAAANEAAKAARLIRDQQRPEYWFEREYQELYGDAGRAVAWGRAMEHRGLEMTPKRALREYAKLVKAGVHDTKKGAESIDTLLRLSGIEEEALEEARGKVLLRELLETAREHGYTYEGEHIRGLAALVGHATSIDKPKRGSLDWADIIAYPDAIVSQTKLERLGRRCMRFYEAMSDVSVKHPTGIVLISSHEDRGGYAFFVKQIGAGRGDFPTIVHEWGHALDHNDQSMADRAMEFRDRRTHFDPARRIAEITGNPRYGEEITREDRFYNAYMGKVYDGALEDFTEVTTMAIQALTDTKPGYLLAIDPDTLYFALGQLAGSKLP